MDLYDDEGALDATMDDPYEGGYIEFGSTVYTTSEKNEDDVEAGAAGYRVFFIVMGGETDGVVTYTGMSNNAVFQAASAFTVAAVAGLFF